MPLRSCSAEEVNRGMRLSRNCSRTGSSASAIHVAKVAFRRRAGAQPFGFRRQRINLEAWSFTPCITLEMGILAARALTILRTLV